MLRTTYYIYHHSQGTVSTLARPSWPVGLEGDGGALDLICILCMLLCLSRDMGALAKRNGYVNEMMSG